VTENLHRSSETAHGEEHPAGLEFVRFVPLERALHATMVVSFITLALTGMTLKFSYTPWARAVSRLLGGFQTAGYIHRFAATIMFCVFVTHLVSLRNLKRRAYKSWFSMILGPNSMLPTLKDGREFVQTMKWFLGKGPRPQYGRWTYWEKFDYFAVFWGIFIIGSTGLTLWFPITFTRILPGWFINLATIIHSDEALLATGFIFTVHFFNTHLRPEKLKRDKPMEYELLRSTGKLRERLAEPHPAVVVKMIRAFAWVALSLGFSIVIGIIYAMIFAYR